MHFFNDYVNNVGVIYYLCSPEEYIKIIIMRTKITALIIVSILVSVGCFAKGTGTLSNPYSAAEACEAVKNLTWTSNADYESTDEVFVKGTISRIANSSTFTETGMFGNASFFIKDKVGDQEFYCYRILYLGNQMFEQGQTDIKVGDEVIVCGKLMNYHENTPQTVSNNAFLYSLNGDNGGYSFIATDLHQVTSDKSQVTSNEWYTIDGQKLNGMPVKKGVYIQNGKKTINN